MTISGALLLGWLSVAGYGEAQRDAVFVAARGESGLRPGAVSRAGHVGLFQYAGARKRALFAYARATGRPWFDPRVQLEFMDREWRAMPQSRLFFAATTREEAFARFCRDYERRKRCPAYGRER